MALLIILSVSFLSAGATVLGSNPAVSDHELAMFPDDSATMTPLAAYSTPNTEFNQTYVKGAANAMIKSSTGGYVLAGTVNSTGANYSGFVGNVSLVKTDSSGNTEWNKTYPRTGLNDVAYSVIQTTDGGYAIAGSTMTSSYGFWDYSNFSQTGGGTLIVTLTRPGAFLLKTDQSGNKEWGYSYYHNTTSTVINGTTYIISKNLFAYSVVQANDGGYMIAGSSNYFAADNCSDVFILKTVQNGTTATGTAFLKPGNDAANSIVKTSDGNYAMTGYTNSTNGNNRDVYLIKTDTNRNMIWSKTYGGLGDDVGKSLIQTTDDGYAVVGYTNSSGEGKNDFWTAKLDGIGNMEWNKTYGGAGSDEASSVIQAANGGYVIVGKTNSFGAGNTDSLLVKTDTSGNPQWNKTYGGLFDDGANSVVQANDGGFAFAGYSTNSSSNYFLLVKLAVVTYAFSVSSAHGNPIPAVGVYNYTSDFSAYCSVVSPVVEGNIVWTCTGFSGTGSVPSSGSSTSLIFAITQDSSITWNWQGTPIQRSLNVVSAHGIPNPSVGNHAYDDAASITCSVVSPVTEGNTVWTCSGWTGTGSVTSSGTGSTTTFSLTQSSSITWNWQGTPIQYTISSSASPNGAISPSGSVSVNYGGSQSFNIEANTSYHIVDVVVDGVSQGAVPSYTFSNVVATHTIAASFAINTYPITITQGANGMIAPGTTTVNHGASQSFTITPSSGYYIASITTDIGSVAVTSSSGQTISFNDVVSAHTLTATYALTPTTTTNPTPNNPTPAPTHIVTPAPTSTSVPTSNPTASSSPNTTLSPTTTVPELSLWTIPLLLSLMLIAAGLVVYNKKRGEGRKTRYSVFLEGSFS